MRINYLIACSSHRVKLDAGYGIQSKDILRMHIEELAKTNTEDLAQVTIIQALPLVRHGGLKAESNTYWDINDALSKIKCPVEKIDVVDEYYSYSSWVHAVLKYRDQFDYYILIEDDYYPAIVDFALRLVDVHKRKLSDGGYLNSFTSRNIAAVSNGLCDSVSFLSGLSKLDNSTKFLAHGSQGIFGSAVFGENMTDYTDEYRTLFNSDVIVEETHNPSLNLKVDIFNPIQYLAVGEQDFGKVCA